MPPILELFGRFHPLLLHLPIGLLIGALVLEVLASRRRLARAALGPYLWIAALAAVVSAAAGWVLAHEDGYGGPTLERHRQLGIALAVAAVLAATLHDPRPETRHGTGAPSGRRRSFYRFALATACALLVPAGHLGSQLTHGTDWLAGPRRAAQTPEPESGATARPPEVDASAESAPGSSEPDTASDAAPVGAEPDLYATRIAPILGARCTSCHGPAKRKADLRLDSPAALLAGGESGPALVPGDPAASPFLVRAKLPLEHEDHMPPEGKPQPTSAELAELEAWIAAGAPFGAAGSTPAGAAVPADVEEPPEAAPAPQPEPEQTGQTLGPPAEALAALDRALVHHELRGPGELALDVAAVAPAFGDAEVRLLLVPLAPWIAELALARSAVTDEGLAELAGFPLLARLDLRATEAGDAGLAALAGHAALAELVLARTRLTDAAVDVLVGLPRLRSVSLWSSGLTAEGLARLRAARPDVVVHAGDEPPAEALESEGELAFTSERPLPGAELVPEALRPVNASCPVSGSPVNPEYSILHGARVVGFCCPNCPKEFWADPARFESKLP